MIPCVISVDMYLHVSMYLWLPCSTLGSSYSNGPIVTLPRLADTLPVNVPDASDWSIDDVERYFKDVGFVEQAEVFREQVWFTWYKVIVFVGKPKPSLGSRFGWSSIWHSSNTGSPIQRVSRPQFCWGRAILCDPPFFPGCIEFGGVVVKFYSSV